MNPGKKAPIGQNVLQERDGGNIQTFRRQLVTSAGLIFVVALAIFVLDANSSSVAAVFSMGIGLVGCSVLALALAA